MLISNVTFYQVAAVRSSSEVKTAKGASSDGPVTTTNGGSTFDINYLM